jgi:hypothetical protein
LVATSDAAVGQDLRDKLSVIINNWEELFQYVEKYMHVGDVTRYVINVKLWIISLPKEFTVYKKCYHSKTKPM